LQNYKTTNAQDLKSILAEQERIRTDVTYNKEKVKVTMNILKLHCIAQLGTQTTSFNFSFFSLLPRSSLLR
uniref:TTKRSYEDQ domain-containing protein n=1 Tax=Ascaris lumbricoides TaxID=6252 RepID=A0A0M3IQY1_ASCLU